MNWTIIDDAINFLLSLSSLFFLRGVEKQNIRKQERERERENVSKRQLDRRGKKVNVDGSQAIPGHCSSFFFSLSLSLSSPFPCPSSISSSSINDSTGSERKRISLFFIFLLSHFRSPQAPYFFLLLSLIIFSSLSLSLLPTIFSLLPIIISLSIKGLGRGGGRKYLSSSFSSCSSFSHHLSSSSFHHPLPTLNYSLSSFLKSRRTSFSLPQSLTRERERQGEREGIASNL